MHARRQPRFKENCVIEALIWAGKGLTQQFSRNSVIRSNLIKSSTFSKPMTMALKSRIEWTRCISVHMSCRLDTRMRTRLANSWSLATRTSTRRLQQVYIAVYSRSCPRTKWVVCSSKCTQVTKLLGRSKLPETCLDWVAKVYQIRSKSPCRVI